MSTSLFTIDDIKNVLSSCDWTNNITWNTNGLTEYLTFDYSEMTNEQKAITKTASKVINSKVLDANNNVVMNWNTALFTNSGNSNMSSIFNSSSTITEWKSDLSSLTNGNRMFYNTAIESFNSDLSSLTGGTYMFNYCTALTSFDSDLSSLTNGGNMFNNCKKLASFNSDLSSLNNGYYMFYYCIALESFDSDLSSLTNGYNMFKYCFALESFNSDLSSLTSGQNMFQNCTALESFDSDLSKLTSGYYMFARCKLDTASVQNIASTINTVSSGSITIGIGNSTPNEEESSAFNTIASKGWTVYVNGTSWTSTASTSSTNLTEEEQPTPIPFYAKPIQVTEDKAEYVDANNNYYNIVGAQFIYGDDISTYGMFTSFEHAESEISLSLGLTKYIKPTEETSN